MIQVPFGQRPGGHSSHDLKVTAQSIHYHFDGKAYDNASTVYTQAEVDKELKHIEKSISDLKENNSQEISKSLKEIQSSLLSLKQEILRSKTFRDSIKEELMNNEDFRESLKQEIIADLQSSKNEI
ncbi:hypothetical protein HN709_01045 [Candidatus Peregrinibacteria bacterium]|nr:hypothetical protein [Candidatus Peregrinibacteria bacterium]